MREPEPNITWMPPFPECVCSIAVHYLCQSLLTLCISWMNQRLMGFVDEHSRALHHTLG